MTMLTPPFPPLFSRLWIAALAAGIAYLPIASITGGTAVVAAKGAMLVILAMAALALRVPGAGWLAVIMAAGAAGDMLLAVPGGFMIGAIAFALGHVVAIMFYMRRRAASTVSRRLIAAALIGYGLAMPALVTPAGTPIGLVMVYAVLLCGMAASLWLSSLPRVAFAGALLFVLSDTLLVMRMGGTLVGTAAAHGAMVWLSYAAGQALICLGVARGLLAER
ncbi:lysoplasmalogenase family protein [Sandarakinorhabdus sp.]|uniref:lysoplasmalogenase family protein n=1 Tax=Sandarakinorhabdus sp. TaxID=1916663 RepID=UPI00286D6CE9|nr:lysoplasmalogenase family protein [Sandarakinorhabdus sp.]